MLWQEVLFGDVCEFSVRWKLMRFIDLIVEKPALVRGTRSIHFASVHENDEFRLYDLLITRFLQNLCEALDRVPTLEHLTLVGPMLSQYALLPATHRPAHLRSFTLDGSTFTDEQVFSLTSATSVRIRRVDVFDLPLVRSLYQHLVNLVEFGIDRVAPSEYVWIHRLLASRFGEGLKLLSLPAKCLAQLDRSLEHSALNNIETIQIFANDESSSRELAVRIDQVYERRRWVLDYGSEKSDIVFLRKLHHLDVVVQVSCFAVLVSSKEFLLPF